VVLRFTGIIMHIMANVITAGGRTLLSFWVYVAENALTALYSILAYVTIIALWQTEGLEVLGFTKGQLTGATILIAYVADSLFMKAVEMRTKSKDVP
jgi:hypothetical protein